MITDEIIIRLNNATKEQRLEIRKILYKNYMNFLDEVENNADYCTTTSYWSAPNIPLSKSLDPQEFIDKFSKTL